jgi:hypothetical protein
VEVLKKELIYFGKNKKKKERNGRKNMMAKIIPFPNVKVSENAKQALKLEERKNVIERNLNVLLGNDSTWDLYTLTADEIDCLSEFGEVMRFDPRVASRLISKLSEFAKKISKAFMDDYGEPY